MNLSRSYGATASIDRRAVPTNTAQENLPVPSKQKRRTRVRRLAPWAVAVAVAAGAGTTAGLSHGWEAGLATGVVALAPMVKRPQGEEPEARPADRPEAAQPNGTAASTVIVPPGTEVVVVVLVRSGAVVHICQHDLP